MYAGDLLSHTNMHMYAYLYVVSSSVLTDAVLMFAWQATKRKSDWGITSIKWEMAAEHSSSMRN